MWMVYVVLALAVMVALGLFKYGWGQSSPVNRFSDRLIQKVAVGGAVIFGILLIKESTNGIIQALDNHLDETVSAAWSVIVFPFVILFVVAMFALLLYAVYYITSLARLGWLYEQLRAQKERKRAREAKRMAAKMGSQYKPQLEDPEPIYMRSMTVIRMDTRTKRPRTNNRLR